MWLSQKARSCVVVDICAVNQAPSYLCWIRNVAWDEASSAMPFSPSPEVIMSILDLPIHLLLQLISPQSVIVHAFGSNGPQIVSTKTSMLAVS